MVVVIIRDLAVTGYGPFHQFAGCFGAPALQCDEAAQVQGIGIIPLLLQRLLVAAFGSIQLTLLV